MFIFSDELHAFGDIDPALSNWANQFSKEINQNISVLPYHALDDPQRNISETLGTFRVNSTEMNIFINDGLFKKHGFGQPLLNGVIVHELLHHEMNLQGFPVTRNAQAFAADMNVAVMGTLLQCSILHIELDARQKERALPQTGLENQKHKLIRELKNKPIYIELVGLLDSKKQLSIEAIFEPLEKVRLTPGHAEKAIGDLILSLGLNDRLEVCPAN